jgi:hypothetical protein
MRILLVNLPVHIPTIMPYSIAMMNAVLSSSLHDEVEVLDLNAYYHFNVFNEYYLRKQEDFFPLLKDFVNNSRHKYPVISRAVVQGRKPEGHEMLLQQILNKKPDIVALSLAYNSQVFFAKGIVSELQERGIKVVVGGPADYSKIHAIVLPDYYSLIDFIIHNGGTRKITDSVLDFSVFKDEYFTKEIVYPLRTSISCPYKRCAFCTHHQNNSYYRLELDYIADSIRHNKMKKVMFIDDDFAIPHITELARVIKPLGIEWWCQLRPVKSIIPLLPSLYDAGLRAVAWGVESGSQRVLDFMQKGTKLEEVEKVLENSKRTGIMNMAYIMFGFPTETEEEAKETIRFLQENQENIDLVSPSTFGLQKESRIYETPEKFGVKEIMFSKRTVFDDKITYTPLSGLTQEQAEALKLKLTGEINRINKVPKIINACKEQILNL